MNLSSPPPFLLRRADDGAVHGLPQAEPGVRRWYWQGRYGGMLIEVRGTAVFVNGEPVEPAVGPPPLRGAG